MNPQCARCGRVVYPTEKVNCLDKYWHKGCFHCEVCKMTLNMNNYKGYDKKPYCNAHYPKQSFTTVADTPENLRLKQQSELQSQVKYKRDFEESKGRGFSIVTDTPELQRLKKTQEQISNCPHQPFICKTTSLERGSHPEAHIAPCKTLRYNSSPSIKMKIPIIIDSTVDDSDEEEKVFPNPVLEDRNVEFAKKCTEYISDISYKEEYKKSKGKNEFVPDTAKLKAVTDSISEAKYKEAGKKELSKSLYKMMPATLDTAFAKQVTQLQSEVLYKQKHDAEKGKSTYTQMLEPPDIKHAMEVNKHQSNIQYSKSKGSSINYEVKVLLDLVVHAGPLAFVVLDLLKGFAPPWSRDILQLDPDRHNHRVSYKKDAQDIHKYTDVMNRPDIQKATENSKIISNVDYKKAKGDLSKETMVMGRPDFEHAKEVSNITSQVKYKEQFLKEMKGKRPRYNPLDSAAFRQAQAATALASDIQYKKDKHIVHDTSVDLPNLLHLEHALRATKLQSNKVYKKQFEENKGNYHFALDTAEQIHHKENAVLQSQVKYREEYEKSKGRSMLEFVDTPSYNVSKEAQKMQSEKLYRKDFEEAIKGKASVDLELTPAFLCAKHAMNLVSEREYRKDLEEGVKGKGLTVLEDTPDLIRVKNASQILSEKEYRKDLENDIKGKGMELSADIPDMIRAKRATELVSEKEYKKDLETEIKGKGMQVGADIPELQHFKRVSELVSQKGYKKDLETEIKGKGMQVGPDIPELQRAKRASEIASQKRYKDEAERMRSTYSIVTDTPEIERVKNAQKSISSVFYKKGLGAGTSIRETPEMERVKITQQNISAVKYKEDIGPATAISDLPEIKRVKENQKNISNVHYKEPLCKATSVSVTPEMELAKKNQEHFSTVHYKEKVGKVTSVGLTPEMERVKKNQENISSVKYSNDLQQMKGRPSVILDTPELRHVRETQNNISMIKYHEDFERTKGRGFTPVSDDPVTERVRKNTQIVSDAAYKGVHPHVVEMDRRPGMVVDLKVWRTDPGSIFDIDPLEDNIQSRSLRMLTERASSRHSGAVRVSQADDRSEVSEMKSSISYYSEGTRASDEGAPVPTGAYHPSQSQGFGYMHQSSMSSMRSMHSPHAHSPSPSMRTFRAMYDYSAQDDDEVSFRDGDYIVNVQPIDEGWMYGTVQRTGKTGMLPANYIEPVN